MKELIISIATTVSLFIGVGVSMFYFGLAATVIAMLFIAAIPVCTLGVHNIIYGPQE